jgi:hypothetical protein
MMRGPDERVNFRDVNDRLSDRPNYSSRSTSMVRSRRRMTLAASEESAMAEDEPR